MASAGFEHNGVYGILGIGTSTSEGPVASPILGMPGGKSNAWSLHLDGRRGTLVLGARTPAPSAAVATIPMKRRGSSGTHALWADSSLDLCTTVGRVRVSVPNAVRLGHGRVPAVGVEVRRRAEVGRDGRDAGHPLAVARRTSATSFWSFVTGTTRAKDLVVFRGGTRAFVNAGIQGYFEFTITYNDVTGAVVLTRPR